MNELNGTKILLHRSDYSKKIYSNIFKYEDKILNSVDNSLSDDSYETFEFCFLSYGIASLYDFIQNSEKWVLG